jgi:hypothetical protein
MHPQISAVYATPQCAATSTGTWQAAKHTAPTKNATARTRNNIHTLPCTHALTQRQAASAATNQQETQARHVLAPPSPLPQMPHTRPQTPATHAAPPSASTGPQAAQRGPGVHWSADSTAISSWCCTCRNCNSHNLHIRRRQSARSTSQACDALRRRFCRRCHTRISGLLQRMQRPHQLRQVPRGP